MYNTHFNKNTINKFYKTLQFTCFRTITDERREELDELVNKHHYYFSQCTGRLTTMHFLAEKLITSYKNFGLRNGDEKAYFYIKIIDPELLFLEVYESSNLLEEMQELCLKNFHIYDKSLIILERYYNERFQEYTPDELWTRERIKR